jgi:hypothetical protein
MSPNPAERCRVCRASKDRCKGYEFGTVMGTVVIFYFCEVCTTTFRDPERFYALTEEQEDK